MGGERELFRKGDAQLYLIDGDESALLQRGEFVLLLVKNSRSPLAAVVAMVGDMQWPVGKDSLVSNLGDTGFSFSNLPARLRYALSLDNLQTSEMQNLELLFREYSTYVHADSQAAVKFWTRLAMNIDADTNKGLPAAPGRTTALLAVQRRGNMSSKLVQRMQQARRMSAVAKLFARSLQRGAINASTHVKKGDTDLHKHLALASVDAVAKVVEAVETAGKTLLENAQAAGTDLAESMYVHREGKEVEGSLDAVDSLITSAWTLNKVGLRMLFRTIASINSSASISQSPSSISSKSPGTASDNNIAQVHAASLALGASSTETSARPVGSALPRGGATRGLQLAEPSLQCRQISPALPPRFRDGAVPRAPSLPPRFYGASVASDHRRVGGGVTTALSLASGAGASTGPGFPSSHVYGPRQQATQLQASQSLAMGIMAPPAPCPPRPPPARPRPFH